MRIPRVISACRLPPAHPGAFPVQCRAVSLGVLLQWGLLLPAQDSLREKTTFSGYIEPYFCYDLSQPAMQTRQPFFYNYTRHNEVNVNLAFVKAAYESGSVRGNLALMAGTYPEYNLAQEPFMLRHIFEANAGLRLSKKRDIWLDAGILPSHIGFESAIGRDCWNVTRSMVADNTPYYEAGIRLAYAAPGKKLYAALLFLNGWQKIQRPTGNEGPSFGSQLTWSPTENFKINWSTYAGNEAIPSKQVWRYYNNFYAELHPWKKTGIIAGFDFGLQQQYQMPGSYSEWWSAVLVLRRSLTNRLAVAARTEYFNDPALVVIRTYSPPAPGFRTFGHSVNVDFIPVPRAMLRLEARMLDSYDAVFYWNGKGYSKNYFFTAAFCLAI